MTTHLPRPARLTLAALAIAGFTCAAHAQTPADLNSMTQAALPVAANTVSAQTLGPKKEGVIHIGLFMPQYELGGQGGPTAGESVRTVEERFLAGPKFEIVRISALLPVQATAEAPAASVA